MTETSNSANFFMWKSLRDFVLLLEPHYPEGWTSEAVSVITIFLAFIAFNGLRSEPWIDPKAQEISAEGAVRKKIQRIKWSGVGL